MSEQTESTKNGVIDEHLKLQKMIEAAQGIEANLGGDMLPRLQQSLGELKASLRLEFLNEHKILQRHLQDAEKSARTLYDGGCNLGDIVLHLRRHSDEIARRVRQYEREKA